MDAENKFYETGSNPYYLNLNNTARDFSNLQDTTNPEYGFMNLLNEYSLIEEPLTVQESPSDGKEKELLCPKILSAIS